MRYSLTLTNPQQGYAALAGLWRQLKPWLVAGHRLVVEVREPKKSREQEEKYHAMIGDVARAVSLIPGRERERPEDAKRLLISAFHEDSRHDLADEWARFGDWRLAPGLRGELVLLGYPSRQFSAPLASAFIEWLYAFGAEHEVRWGEPVGQVGQVGRRDEAYRRRVAALACANCGLIGHSQAAHPNGYGSGKGMALKADDHLCFPLCADQPGIVGCHTLHDQGGLVPKSVAREREAEWIEWTREQLERECV